MLCSDFNAAVKGLNAIGLKRAGFTHTDMGPLKKAYRLLFRSGLKLEDALRRIETEYATPHSLRLVEFIRRSERGICTE
jgi:UDP-N-acetylglucosamine acyltransferase